MAHYLLVFPSYTVRPHLPSFNSNPCATGLAAQVPSLVVLIPTGDQPHELANAAMFDDAVTIDLSGMDAVNFGTAQKFAPLSSQKDSALLICFPVLFGCQKSARLCQRTPGILPLRIAYPIPLVTKIHGVTPDFLTADGGATWG